MSLSSEVEVYQFRVYLREISPMIWRRLLLRSDQTIADLHYTLQIAMGWDDFHLHQFTIRGKRYGVSRIYGPDFLEYGRDVPLHSFQFRQHERFLYEYDFGDRWEHEVRFEKSLPLDPKKTYPVCIGGKRGGHQKPGAHFRRNGGDNARVRDFLPRLSQLDPRLVSCLLEVAPTF